MGRDGMAGDRYVPGGNVMVVDTSLARAHSAVCWRIVGAGVERSGMYIEIGDVDV